MLRPPWNVYITHPTSKARGTPYKGGGKNWKELKSQMMEKDMTWPPQPRSLARDHSVSHQATVLGLSGLLTKTGEDVKRGEESVANIQEKGHTHIPTPPPCPTQVNE